MGIIRVGTSSWADRLLLRSGWYPRSANTPATRIAHYASRFDLVEVDTPRRRLEQARDESWTVVSMKDDWATVFAEPVVDATPAAPPAW